MNIEKLKSPQMKEQLKELKELFENSCYKCWEIANDYDTIGETPDKEIYDKFAGLAIDCEERMNEIDKLL